MSSGAMQSNVGNAQIHNDGDQRISEADRRAEVERQKADMAEGQKGAHKINDPKDNRNLNNRARQEAAEERLAEVEERQKTVTDPLEPAKRHGNEPSRGAQVDAELQAEDEEILRKKGSYNGTSH